MTWDEYIDARARRLAEARKTPEFSSELDAIEREIAKWDPPADFWDRLARRYEKHPKPLIKESNAAAALNALVTSAQDLIRARGAK